MRLCLFCSAIVTEYIAYSIVYHLLFLQILEYMCGVHTGLSLIFSEVCGGLPWPIVRRNSASWQCGASQCGGVSVCLQGGPGLWRPGDSGLWHEGKASQNHNLPHYRERAQTYSHVQ